MDLIKSQGFQISFGRMMDSTTLTELWWKKDKNGIEFLSGNLDAATKVMVLPNIDKTSKRDPDYYLYLGSMAEEDEAAKVSASDVARGVMRLFCAANRRTASRFGGSDEPDHDCPDKPEERGIEGAGPAEEPERRRYAVADPVGEPGDNEGPRKRDDQAGAVLGGEKADGEPV